MIKSKSTTKCSEYADIHSEIQEILCNVKLAAEGVTEQNNNLFMTGYQVGYNDAYELLMEQSYLLIQMISIVKRVESTLGCHLIDDELAASITKIMGEYDYGETDYNV